MYLFEGIAQYDNKTEGSEGKEKICISNEKNLTMKLAPRLYNDIKASICTNPEQCVKESDFKSNQQFKFEVKMVDHVRQDDVFIAKFEKQSLYKIVDGEVIWKIATLNEREVQAGCDIILEDEYLKGKYLMISNNIE